jgi:hypothetical protein
VAACPASGSGRGEMPAGGGSGGPRRRSWRRSRAESSLVELGGADLGREWPRHAEASLPARPRRLARGSRVGVRPARRAVASKARMFESSGSAGVSCGSSASIGAVVVAAELRGRDRVRPGRFLQHRGRRAKLDVGAHERTAAHAGGGARGQVGPSSGAGRAFSPGRAADDRTPAVPAPIGQESRPARTAGPARARTPAARPRPSGRRSLHFRTPSPRRPGRTRCSQPVLSRMPPARTLSRR